MDVLQHHPVDGVGDFELMERLFEIAFKGGDEGELVRLDAVVYERLAEAYAEPSTGPGDAGPLAA
ncbi:hypothetical protein [Lysobacter sp. A3-1-A15]|uniref:hypothetical protein n=1 Tax=Novilysobacter viscosus TaxID=3098602 RepID=UPI002EDACEAE